MQPSRRDFETLRHCWAQLRTEIPPATRGLWFGITDLESGGAYRTLYVAGCPTFDADDADGDWATDYCWWPEARYVTLADFAMLPGQPYLDVLAYAAELLRTLDVSAVPTIEGAAVGFDDGDFVVL